MGFPDGLDVDHQRKSGVKDFEDQATATTEEKAKHLIWDMFIVSYLLAIQEKFQLNSWKYVWSEV